VRRLVGIDVGVLDDDLAAGRGHTFFFAPQQRRCVSAAVEAKIDIAVTRHFERRHAGYRPDLGGQLGRDFLRRLAQSLGKLERRRHRDFAEIALPRLLDGDTQIHAVANLYVRVKRVCDLLFDGMEHGNLEYNSRTEIRPDDRTCFSLPEQLELSSLNHLLTVAYRIIRIYRFNPAGTAPNWWRNKLRSAVHKQHPASVSSLRAIIVVATFLLELSRREDKDSMNGRHKEYERLIAPIEGRMMRAVWRVIRDPNDVEDAFQEALLTVWKRWDRICMHPNPQALVLQICINSAHDALRRKLRQGKWLEAGVIPEDIPDSTRSAAQDISGAEQETQVRRAIGFLPKNQARAILMHAVEEIPYGDIAAAMDCRESTVRKHVARARAKLRGLLSHLIPAVHKEESSHA